MLFEKTNKNYGHLLVAALLILISLAGVAGAASAKSAKEILAAAGVQGGFVVHIGSDDIELTADFRASDSFLVLGLQKGAAAVQAARKTVEKRGLAGKVSIAQWNGKDLPLTDNIVNLLVVEDMGALDKAEAMRVLCPEGRMIVKSGNDWRVAEKPRPADIDTWTHYLHNAAGNAVAKDKQVGPPRHMQWLSDPLWTRSHHNLASISALVSDGKRIYYIMDGGPSSTIDAPSKWSLVARDAFNGAFLWRRTIADWANHKRKFRSGPVQLPRLLVAEGGRVYATLGVNTVLTAMDGATGETLETYSESQGTEEVILDKGTLFVLAADSVTEQYAAGAAVSKAKQKNPDPFSNRKRILAIAAETGKTLWTWKAPESVNPVPLTLCAGSKYVSFQLGAGVVSLDRRTGDEAWRTPETGGKDKRAPGAASSTLVSHDDLLIWTDGKKARALRASDGKELWSCESKAGFRSPTDVLIAGDLVWLGNLFTEGRDLRTGKVVKSSKLMTEEIQTVGHHHRCYRNKGTEQYIIASKRGLEFMDLVGDNHSRNNWVRGLCQYGVMPCNGLIYAPPHNCGCYMEAKLYGFWALSAERKTPVKPFTGERLVKGPAYGKISKDEMRIPGPNDWPTLRRDGLRSGAMAEKVVPSNRPLGEDWTVEVGGNLTPPVVAGGLVLLASIDDHRVVALDASSGKKRWTYLAGGRIDSPPTIHQGMALFGSADGSVTCLRLADGELVWRFFAAPTDRRTIVRDEVESVWPVHGNILVDQGVAYFSAGRSTYLDGGLRLYGLDPASGKILCQTLHKIENPHTSGLSPEDLKDLPSSVHKFVQNATDTRTFLASDKSDAFSMDGGNITDVMVTDGESIYLRHERFDRNLVKQEKKSRHLFSTSRLIDDAEVHRSHWVVGTGDFSRLSVAYSWIGNRTGGAYNQIMAVPHGLMLSYDADTVWVVRSESIGKSYTLYSEPNAPFCSTDAPLPDFRKAENKTKPPWTWSVELGIHPHAMLRAGDDLILAGTPTEIDEADPFATFEGRKGGLLRIHSATDGANRGNYDLEAPPVWDGLAATGKNLYISLQNGKVTRLGAK